MIENAILIEVHHVQDTLDFLANEETLKLLNFLLSERVGIVFWVHPTPEIDSTVEITLSQIGFHQVYVPDLCVHLEDLLI